MADTLNQTMRWIRSARVVDEAERHAIVTENDGTNMELSLTPPFKRDLAFVHNDSRIDDFHVTIIVDRFSNTVLNITAYNASGVLNGYVKPIGDVLGETIDTFSVTASQFGDGVHERGTQQLIARIKPYAVNTVHMVCIRPDEGPRDAEICRPVESVYDELETNTITNVWSNAKGNCPECNKLSMDGFMKYLNPANWTKGVSSISEAFMMASDIFGYLFVFLVFYVVLAKFVLPLLQCCFCPFLYSRSK
ncbi:CRE-EFF-1 protein [Aphelenchoides avenae]|nr:CRE-EFF-1 protein [Aphelenchus avenae]